MKKRIAIPMNGPVLSAHFGHCDSFAFVEVEDNMIKDIQVLPPPEHTPGTFPKWVSWNGATDVIAGGMGNQAVNLFIGFGINVFAGAPVRPAEELVRDFLDGKLSLNANYCDHPDGHHNHKH